MAGGGALEPEDVEGCMITHKFLKNGSVKLHYVECGSLENQLVSELIYKFTIVEDS